MPMDQKKIYMTKSGIEELKKELSGLTQNKRPEVLEAMSEARMQGDLSENAEYHAAKEELSFIDGRIDEIEEMLKRIEEIDEKAITSKGKHIVGLGSKVTLHVSGKKHTYTMVGEFEADPQQKKISDKSPLGKALIGRSIGEKIAVEAPAGKVVYTIVSIT